MVDAVRLGQGLRALRRRRGWTQAELARRARVSQSAVSRVERGDLPRLTLRTLDQVAEAVGARVSLRLLWQGEALDRLLDAAHTDLVDRVAALLVAAGWEVVPEATFNHFGERGSIDVLARHPDHGAVLVVEVKSVLPDVQALLAGLDRKHRIAPRLAVDRDWRVRDVSRLIVLPDDRTTRRRVATHASTFDLAYPARTRAVRRWIFTPAGRLAGILFLPASQRTTTRHRVTGPRRSKGAGSTANRPAVASVAAGQSRAGDDAGSGRPPQGPVPVL